MTVDVRVGEKNYVAEYLESRTESGVQMFFVRCDEFFDRPEIYGDHGGLYEDNAARFIFFSKAAIELARRLTPVPQICTCTIGRRRWCPSTCVHIIFPSPQC